MNRTAKLGLALLLLVTAFFVILGLALRTRKAETPQSSPKPSDARYRFAQAGRETGYLSVREVLQFQGCDCLYVKRRGAPSNLDGNGAVWSGKLHDAGIFPNLGVNENGFVKTVMRIDRDLLRATSGDPLSARRYRIIYMREDQLTTDYRRTEWYVAYGDYSDVVPEVPQLCPRPGLGLLAQLSLQ